MQTFVPFPSFAHSVACLDRARLGKQRVECGQILTALRLTQVAGASSVGWSQHPCTRMWRGHEGALGLYMTLCVWEWEARGYSNTMVTPYGRDLRRNALFHFYEGMAEDARDAVPPLWLGREDVHASHRGRLLHKDPEYYGRFGWTDAPRTDEEGYCWPV